MFSRSFQNFVDHVSHFLLWWRREHVHHTFYHMLTTLFLSSYLLSWSSITWSHYHQNFLNIKLGGHVSIVDLLNIFLFIIPIDNTNCWIHNNERKLEKENTKLSLVEKMHLSSVLWGFYHRVRNRCWPRRRWTWCRLNNRHHVIHHHIGLNETPMSMRTNTTSIGTMKRD